MTQYQAPGRAEDVYDAAIVEKGRVRSIPATDKKLDEIVPQDGGEERRSENAAELEGIFTRMDCACPLESS